MVTGLGLITDPGIDARVFQVRRQLGIEQQVVDAQPGIAFPMLAKVIPEGKHLLIGV
ncbi:hypothetical protein D3C81_2092170 [compost metagenome]